MSKKNGKIKIQEEREKRLQQIATLEYRIAKQQQALTIDRESLLKQIGALEQLDELEGIAPPVPSDNGTPAKETVLEEKES
ncbi:MAG: hypothetical protein E3J60_04590 [Dehalococcoidia bacterium]|nr:MAG: hypothetical protein E3J60_04590 [Dehalococcoidia bacterium]